MSEEQFSIGPLSREQVEMLSSLLTELEGQLQYRASQRSDGALDEAWRFWHGITKVVTGAAGWEAFRQPSRLVDQLLGREHQEKHE